MAVSSFVPVSLEPALVAFCVQRTSTTWPKLRDRPRLGISVLGELHDRAARRLASRTEDRFSGLALSPSSGGALAIDGCPTFLNCSVEREVAGGDHDIVILRVHSLRTRPGQAPLVFHGSRFRALQRLPG
jgi:flavin reductase (DIM6/NTAB) family NADH-FMN oxidoreductase RutF